MIRSTSDNNLMISLKDSMLDNNNICQWIIIYTWIIFIRLITFLKNIFNIQIIYILTKIIKLNTINLLRKSLIIW